MLIWFIFYLLQIAILFFAESIQKINQKKFLYAISAIVAIYFSAFRDGLGQDYEGYLEKLSWVTDLEGIWKGELLFNILSVVVNTTIFSPVFYFLFCSIVTIVLLWKYFSYSENGFVFLTFILFLSIPGMYFNTFNLTRQFFSTSIFFYSLKYIERRNLLKYSVMVLLASMMHMSALILWPLYFVLNRRYNMITYILFFCSSVLVAFSIKIIISSIAFFAERYDIYTDTEASVSGFTLTFICLVLLAVDFFLVKRGYNRRNAADDSPYFTMGKNLLILYTLVSCLSYINFYFFRLSIYFIPSVCVMMPHILYKFFRSKIFVYMLCILLSLFYFITFIVSNENNLLICPKGILPVSSLFD